jgi:hypothetical protein
MNLSLLRTYNLNSLTDSLSLNVAQQQDAQEFNKLFLDREETDDGIIYPSTSLLYSKPRNLLETDVISKHSEVVY